MVLPAARSCAATHAAIRDLQRHLADAGDAKLLEIVALVDSLPIRGDADRLIAPLRGRLRKLRPARRINLARLMFLPADGVIVPAAAWRRGAASVPRHVLPCLANAARAWLGEDHPRLAAQVDGLMSDDPKRILACGRLVWPRIGSFLASLHMPPSWAGMTGLGLADFTQIARGLSVVLRAATRIEEIIQAGGENAAQELAWRDCLTEAWSQALRVPEHTDPVVPRQSFALCLAVLLSRMPSAEPVLLAAAGLAQGAETGEIRGATDEAIDALLDLAEASLSEAAAPLARLDGMQIAGLLEVLDQPGSLGRPTRRARVGELRRRLDENCRAQMGRGLGPLPRDPALHGADVQLDLESRARDLRRLEAVGRRIGQGASYERALAECAHTLPEMIAPARRCDVARLLEILQGPEAALAYFDRDAAAAAPS